MSIKYVSEEASRDLITFDIALETASRALQLAADGSAAVFPSVLGHGSKAENRVSIKAASTPDSAGGKVGTYWPGNASSGRPCHKSTIFLVNEEVGGIGSIVVASVANSYRTAAANAVAASYLARANSTKLAIFGTGNQASFECEAITKVREIDEIFVVGRSPDRSNDLAERVSHLVDRVHVVDGEHACRSADIIVTATSARAPLFEACWVAPGTHVASMGSDGYGKQELPAELLHEADLFSDLPSQSILIGEFQHIADSIRCGAKKNTAIGDVIQGRRPGRSSDNAITVFDSSGIALQDICLGQRLIAEASKAGYLVLLD
jgi:ornithine cyclodeaminase